MRKLRPYLRQLQNQSYTWKLKYRCETGSLKGRIHELINEEHAVRCDLIDALGWLEVWTAHGAPTEAECEHVASFVKHLRTRYPQQKARVTG
jgi:hypothetical protein